MALIKIRQSDPALPVRYAYVNPDWVDSLQDLSVRDRIQITIHFNAGNFITIYGLTVEQVASILDGGLDADGNKLAF